MNRPKPREWCAVPQIYDPLAAGSIDGTDEDPHDRAVIRAMCAKYKPNQGVRGNPLCTVFVSHLNHITEEDAIQELFSRYGRIHCMRLLRDVVTGFSKGYAFIEYEDEHQALRAQRDGNGCELDGRQLFVDMENERLIPGWVPRRLGGGLGGKRESGQLRFGGKARPFKRPLMVSSQGADAKTEPSVERERSDFFWQKRWEQDRNGSSSSRNSSRRNRSRSRSRDRDHYRHRRHSRSRSRERYSRTSSRRSRSRSRGRSHGIRHSERD